MTAPAVAAKIEELRKEIAERTKRGEDTRDQQEELAYLELTAS
jgi:hypothetical protein